MEADDRDVRAQAMSHLRSFCARLLPGTVRRIATWKRLAGGELPHLLDDLRQELALDCLANAAMIVALCPSQRHGRWMRLCERWVYRHHVRGRAADHAIEDAPAPAHEPPGPPPPGLPDEWVRMGNGRSNLAASALRNGQRLEILQGKLERVVARAGRGPDYHEFWRARLAEALIGLAADLLLDRGAVHVLPRARRCPDPRGRLRRIRAIVSRFHVLPSTIDVRRAARPWVRRPCLDDHAPLLLLSEAVRLLPFAPGAWLWLFEAHLAAGHLHSAARAIRRCRACSGERAALLLARARLLEARGRWSAAIALLRRAARRWPLEVRVRQALAAVSA